MARLIDKILASGLHESGGRQFDASLALAEVLVIDNVAKYIFESKETFTLDSFPNIAPPFDNFFADFYYPRFQYFGDSKRLEVADSSCKMAGAHCRVIDLSEDESTKRDRLIEIAPLSEWGNVLSVLMQHGVLESRWVMITSTYWEDTRGVIRRSPARQYTAILPNGESPKDDDGKAGFITVVDETQNRNNVPLEVLKDIGKQALYPTCLALSFLHCKNVSLIQQTPPAPLSKKFQKKHGRPLVRYHVLDIEPMKQVLRTEGESEKTGLKKALHICRGHFKDYRQRGLFGKLKGLYWWDSHARGSVDVGIVDKDYRVKEPKP